jgi:NADH:ubiquinone oxidoreductase subunit 6 (subunit J)
MNAALVAIAFLILAGAAVAMSLRNLVHSVLLLVASWVGIALFYLWAGAEFAAFAQVLVYVGAGSMVVLFAVLLTRQSRDEAPAARPPAFGRAVAALLAGSAVAGVLAGAVLATPLDETPGPAPAATVRALGVLLMGRHAAALLAAGVILTAALLGAVVIAAAERRTDREGSP